MCQNAVLNDSMLRHYKACVFDLLSLRMCRCIYYITVLCVQAILMLSIYLCQFYLIHKKKHFSLFFDVVHMYASALVTNNIIMTTMSHHCRMQHGCQFC